MYAEDRNSRYDFGGTKAMTFLSKEVAALSAERWFGLDLAKRETQLSVLDALGKEVFSKRFATTREQFLALAAELRETDTVALEVTTNSNSIARLIRDNSKAKVIVSNPIKTKIIAQAKIKTDKIDARVLAELARVGYLPEVWLPDEDTEALRQFFSDRTSLVRRRTESKNTIHSILHRNLIHQTRTDLFGPTGREWLDQIISGASDLKINELDRLRMGSLLNEIDRIDALVADQESIIASFIAVRPKLLEKLDRLMSIHGVNLVTGMLFFIGQPGQYAESPPFYWKVAFLMIAGANFLYLTVFKKAWESGHKLGAIRCTQHGTSSAFQTGHRWIIVHSHDQTVGFRRGSAAAPQVRVTVLASPGKSAYPLGPHDLARRNRDYPLVPPAGRTDAARAGARRNTRARRAP
jgi:transposase